MFNRNNAKSIATTLASFATNGSSGAPTNVFAFASAGEIVGIRFAASTSQPAATTTASGLTINVWKNASDNASLVGTFNTSGTGVAAATMKSGSLVSATLKKFAAGDVVVVQAVGGVAMGSTLNSVVGIDYVYGYED